MSVAWSHPMLMVIHFCSNQRGDFSWLSPLYIWIEYIVWWVIYGQILILDGLTPPARSPLLQQGIAKKTSGKKTPCALPSARLNQATDMEETWPREQNWIWETPETQHTTIYSIYICYVHIFIIYHVHLCLNKGWTPGIHGLRLDRKRSCNSGAAVVGAIFKETMQEESGPLLGAAASAVPRGQS